MKRRYRITLNLFSLAFLLFALYLNFLRSDQSDAAVLSINQNDTSAASASLKKTTNHTGLHKPSDGTMVLK